MKLSGGSNGGGSGGGGGKGRCVGRGGNGKSPYSYRGWMGGQGVPAHPRAQLATQ